VFFMDPEHGATGEPVVFAQLTVPSGTIFTGQLSAQGKGKGDAKDWDTRGVRFTNGVMVDGKAGEQSSCPEASDSMVVQH